MRLVCPNCEAKYEVPDDAIPDTGRDVQCTNCSHTWFQMRGRLSVAVPLAAAVAEAVEPAPTASAAAEAVPEPEAAAVATDAATEDMAAVEAEPEPQLQPEPEPAPEVAAETEEAAAPAVPESVETVVAEAVSEASVDVMDAPPADVMAEPEAVDAIEPPGEVVAETALEAFPAEEAGQAVAETPKAEAAMDAPGETEPAALADPVDDQASSDVGDAASAEAEPAKTAAAYAVDDSVLAILREEAEREANARRAEALESQTDLGIDAAVPRKSGAKPVEVEAKPTARRDLLPDVEEINSTLRPSETVIGTDGTPDFVAPPPQAPHGFRSGFLTLMTVAILAAALYIVAPRLMTLVPALAGPLETYVSLVDGLRLGLDGMMRSATVAISGG